LNGRRPTAAVTKILSPQTIGEDHPRPGTSVAHLIPSVFDQRSGAPDPTAIPLRSCPRNPGQVSSFDGSAAAPVASNATRVRARRHRAIIFSMAASVSRRGRLGTGCGIGGRRQCVSDALPPAGLFGGTWERLHAIAAVTGKRAADSRAERAALDARWRRAVRPRCGWNGS
jgi:hypothetical protein